MLKVSSPRGIKLLGAMNYIVAVTESVTTVIEGSLNVIAGAAAGNSRD